MEVLVQNRETDFQVLLVDIHRALHPEDNPENQMVIHPGQDLHFQVNVQGVNQVGSNLDFQRVNSHRVGILVDVPRFPFRAANQQADLVQDIHPAVPVHQVGQVRDQEDFHRDQVLGILTADLVGKHQVFQVDKDIRVVDPVSQKVPDIPADKLLEVIPVKHKDLVQEVDILVEDQAMAIQEVLRDLVVAQVLKDQTDIQDQEDLKVLEVSKAQVDHLAEVILLLDQELKDQEAIQVNKDLKDQEAIQVVRAAQLRKDRVVILADQDHKGQEATRANQDHKGQEAFLAAQHLKDQKDSQVDQVHRDQEDSQVLTIL